MVSVAKIEPKGRAGGEITALTGLRLVAAAVVLLGHYKPVMAPYYDQVPLLRPLLDAGWLGVEVFFVLSGFVIARSYVEELGSRFSPGRAATFLFNRFARIWPVWALLTTVLGLWVWVLRSRGMASDVVVPHPPADLPTYLGQLSMTQMWGVDPIVGPSYVMPGWSISAEWAAYLAFPVLALVLLPLRRLTPWVPFALATLAMSPLAVTAFREGPLDPEVSWLLRLSCSFVAGVLVAIGMLRVPQTERVERAARVVAIGCTVAVLLGCYWAFWRRAGDPAHDYNGVQTILFPALIGSLSLTARGPASWLSRRWVVYGGRISYCLYLVHFAVYDVLLTALHQTPGLPLVTPGLALAMPLVLVVCVLLAAALHHGVELPARRLLMSWRTTAVSRLATGRRPLDDGTVVVREPAPVPLPRHATSREERPVPTAGRRELVLDAPGRATRGSDPVTRRT